MPIRTCVGCGSRESQSQLMRFTLGPEGALVPGRGEGRGGYLHPQRRCVRAFTAARSGFVRSLRVVVSRETRERYATLLEPSMTLWA
ncbi:MAG: DUF448 domain-containing protein [Deltaproteobacteria bacterium]|nr:DUF448 domain-containing protein [Deltaproteobacteria bacterium]